MCVPVRARLPVPEWVGVRGLGGVGLPIAARLRAEVGVDVCDVDCVCMSWVKAVSLLLSAGLGDCDCVGCWAVPLVLSASVIRV